jgi:hypothetical protein
MTFAEDDGIIITMRGTPFSVTYEKHPKNPHVLLTRSLIEPTVTSPTIVEFRARASKAAVAKARDRAGLFETWDTRLIRTP